MITVLWQCCDELSTPLYQTCCNIDDKNTASMLWQYWRNFNLQQRLGNVAEILYPIFRSCLLKTRINPILTYFISFLCTFLLSLMTKNFQRNVSFDETMYSYLFRGFDHEICTNTNIISAWEMCRWCIKSVRHCVFSFRPYKVTIYDTYVQHFIVTKNWYLSILEIYDCQLG